jgi:hypothetical protein
MRLHYSDKAAVNWLIQNTARCLIQRSQPSHQNVTAICYVAREINHMQKRDLYIMRSFYSHRPKTAQTHRRKKIINPSHLATRDLERVDKQLNAR